MAQRKNIVIIGATSAMAEHCARLWLAEAAADVTLIGRDTARMEIIAADLRVRSPESSVTVVEGQFRDPVEIQGVVDAIRPGDPVDIALIAHGFLPDQEAGQNDLTLCRDALEINAVSPALYAEAFAARMMKSGYGAIIIIGSVAGDRGRKSNYIYGSAKGLLNIYAQGLQHRLAFTSIRVTLVKPGPTATPMTARMNNAPKNMASVESVARDIVLGADRGAAVVYTPAKWRLIMLIVRLVPNFLFHKTNL
ncbi:SDR family NAD(P)-dependent oxidoreductase [Rhizobium daejeonense]